MELNAKISSLEDEVKLLKGEVKLILSEIRAAILSQNNPFGGGQGAVIGVDASDTRPPIRVVKLAEEQDEEEEGTPAISAANSWDEGEDARVAAPQVETPPAQREDPQPPPRRAAETAPQAMTGTPPARDEAPAMQKPAALPRQEAPATDNGLSWSLIKVAGLAVWAEEALKQVGPERLEILLDLCEFAGYLPKSAKEALMRVMNLGIAIDERTEPPSVNECLVILYQLHALMEGEKPEALRGRLSGAK
ncbi:MAG: hypothetical protein QME71_05085 [Dehalococcoidia bacterium]|nr:hypothetical protein [Dehalococcoidia bacterium]